MKNSIFHGDNDINIGYVFCPSRELSDTLVIAFPGVLGGIPGGEWGYMMTIQDFDVNILFIKSDTELNQSWLTYKGGEPLIENAIKSLIDKYVEETGVKHIVATGSSMGGICALYYGLKYDYDIISGCPPYAIEDDTRILYAMGNYGEDIKNQFNEYVRDIVREAGKRGYNNKIFIYWGEGEYYYKSFKHGQKLIKDLTDAGIDFKYKLYPYSDHVVATSAFPNILKGWLNHYLGFGDPPEDNESEYAIMPELRYHDGIKDIYADVQDSLKVLSVNTVPFTDINDPVHYGEINTSIGLRYFVYIEQGYYWGSDYTEPVKIADKNSLWKCLPKDKMSEGLSFWFQDTILAYYEQERDPKVLAWCAKNAKQYIRYVYNTSDANVNKHWWNVIRRVHFFIILHKHLAESDCSDKWISEIPDLIRSDLETLLAADFGVIEYEGQLRRVLTLLHAAVYFKNDEKFYNDCFAKAIEALQLLLDYYFNKDGICIMGQTHDHNYMTHRLRQCLMFVKANSMSETKQVKKLNRLLDKACDFACHFTTPDLNIIELGHSVSEKAWWTREYLTRKSGNFIRRLSNIAILNDEDNLAYITVNGLSNTRSRYKHCDLTAFTFWYEGCQMFADPGGGRENLDIFAASAIAHNGFIADDKDYIIPSYTNFTAIDSFTERDDCVIINISNVCYQGIILKRRLMWIKPNIIILYDRAESDTEHKYTQNFVMSACDVDYTDPTHIRTKSSKGVSAEITQFMQNNPGITLYYGTVDANAEKYYRGSLISNYTVPVSGRNLAYNLIGNTASFLTSVEIHGSEKISCKEHHVKSVELKLGKLAVTMEDGTMICE